MIPKGFRKNIDLVSDKVGPARRREILDGIANQGTFLPRSVDYPDMDSSFIDFVTDDIRINIEGKRVPIYFLTLQRWNQFSRTWKFADVHKDVQLPFITIVRKPNPQVGTNQNGWWNIPGRRNYVYMKVPTFDGNRKGVDLYKIPQPTSVDITYEVRLFTQKMTDLNKYNKKIQKAFQSRQFYVFPNGHPMPIHLESIGDESNISNFQERRFYVQQFEMLLMGYVLDDEDFEVKPAVSRALVLAEISETPQAPRFKVRADKDNGTVTYDVIFKPLSENNFTFKAAFDIKFSSISNIQNITNVNIKENGNTVFAGLSVTTPFIVNANSTIKITVVKNDTKTAKFTLFGSLL